MKKFIKSLLSQKIINIFFHLPKAILANIYYGFPSRKLTVIGITGTDGKTTTTNMVYQILKEANKKVSMVSTVNAEIAGKVVDTGFHVTSPDPFMVQRFAKQALDHGDEYLILEVTSHALDQFRFWGIKFNIGVITNITHDHLDYHQTWENYFQTKAKLIKDIKVAVLNRDEKHFERLVHLTHSMSNIISFGFSKTADFNPIKLPLKIKMLGEYNLLNGLAAAAVASELGIDHKIIKQTLENFSNLSGRMQVLKNSRGIKVIVDFAHTPNALEQALKTLRKETKGRLISVFGCAGLRDEKKRPLMGRISTSLADLTVITAEDPRGLLDSINQQIVAGVNHQFKENKDYFVVGDREKAIEFAIRKLARRDDTVGVFGKGHETSMNYDGKTEIPWSDVKVAKKYLNGH
ncbi:MAG: UDP-N-acetylmuramoyl-L-alanyl-D-glutamate--2,6-diaminopimelate ligase [Candidatus Daviesbacteria bacterium]|nr:MAG: UDP-N-acetylmuramoyl-L-alanyl-D-glutamate--2,6-diaminopimelate ligase [Candidatus Daviesbacteria bacterium]